MKMDLTGLCILTECASMAYAYTPIIALIAGANHVIACGRDTRFGSFEQNKRTILDIAIELGVQNRISFFKDFVPPDYISKVDIVTNSGQIRPITKEMISCLKDTAVISLMWETWEFRSADLDITACQERNIPVIGTNEDYEKIRLFDYDGLLAIKLLLDLGIEVHNNRILIFGGGIVGKSIEKAFAKLSIWNYWITHEPVRSNDSTLIKNMEAILELEDIDAIIFTEFDYKDELIGERAPLSFADIKRKFPAIRIGHISGNIDINELSESGLHYLPHKINPIGYVSYGLEQLGNKPVIQLMAAGLKVGEIAAHQRIDGKSIEETITKTVEYGIGQDFKEGFLNFRP